jgi:hypothetical protein
LFLIFEYMKKKFNLNLLFIYFKYLDSFLKGHRDKQMNKQFKR